MENEIVVPAPQPNAGDADLKPEETVTIPKKDFDDLSHRADVSSQNFERMKKAEGDRDNLQASLDALLANPNPSGDQTEEIRIIRGQLAEVNQKFARTEVLETFPQLKALWTDFETFRNDPENKGMNIKTAAKAFLTEKGILAPKRDGLERPSGGQREPIPQGMTAEDIKHLRETNYKKYADMVRKGLIKV